MQHTYLDKEKLIIDHESWINAGLYHLSPDSFYDWDGLPFSLEKIYFTRCVKDKKLCAVKLITEFIDIGVPEDFYRAQYIL